MQFKLSTLMLSILGFAIFLGLSMHPYGIALLMYAMILVTVGGIIYCRDSWRAFWIGYGVGVVPACYIGLPASLMGSGSSNGFMLPVVMIVLQVILGTGGLVIVFVRWFCLGRQDEPPTRTEAAGD